LSLGNGQVIRHFSPRATRLLSPRRKQQRVAVPHPFPTLFSNVVNGKALEGGEEE
jgi:hypothetical protein